MSYIRLFRGTVDADFTVMLRFGPVYVSNLQRTSKNEVKQHNNMRNFKDIRIAVAGTGYVGLSIATLLSQHHHVTAVDVVPEKVEKINNRISPILDDYIEKFLAEKPLDLVATLDGRTAYADADFVVIAALTNYDSVRNYFDTSHVEEVSMNWIHMQK